MRKLVTLVLLVLLAAKIAAVVARGPVALERDAFGYWHLSTIALHGDPLLTSEPIAYRTPVYPWFVALLRAAFGTDGLLAISFAQGFFAFASIVMAGLLATRISRLPLAMPFTLLAALPAVSSSTYCSAILSESLFVFLLMLHLWSVVSFAERGTSVKAIWVGITFVLALLTRPIVLMLWLPHLVLLAGIQLRGLRKPVGKGGRPNRFGSRLAHLGIAAVVAASLCTPWMLRNDYQFGKPFLTQFLGRNLWVVTFQDGSGTGLALPDTAESRQLQRRLERVDADDQWQSTWNVSNALVASGLDDAAADRLMQTVATDAILAHQSEYLYKAFRRTVNYWRCPATELPNPNSQSNPNSPSNSFFGQRTWHQDSPFLEWVIERRGSQSVAANTAILFLLMFSLLVLLINPVTRVYAVWLALILGYFCVVTGTLEIPDYRYRMVVEPLVACVIGASAAVLLSRRRRKTTLVNLDGTRVDMRLGEA